MLSILVCHSYFLRFDQKQQERAKPYPPLATLQVAAMLRKAGHEVSLFDAMLADDYSRFERQLEVLKPQLVLFYEDNYNFLSKMCLGRMRRAACEMITLARARQTRIVAGGSDESDLELLTTTDWLMKNVRLTRAYYSAFYPIRDTPMENKAAVNPLREHRLYQASFLLRDYGFDLEDMPFVQDGNLPLATDPKLAWAEQNLSGRPLEINRAERRELLRIPGIGPKGADAILRARRTGKLRDLASLKKLGVVTTRVAPFILLDGRRADRQPALFS